MLLLPCQFPTLRTPPSHLLLPFNRASLSFAVLLAFLVHSLASLAEPLSASGDMEELFVTERSTAKGGQRMEVKDDISGLETRIDRFAMGMVFGFVALGGLVLVKAGRGHAPQR